MKILEKEKKKDKYSSNFDQNLFKGDVQQYQDSVGGYDKVITDPDKVLENCNKMNSLLAMIDKNRGTTN